MQFDIQGAQIQKIYSSSRFINFICRKPGKTFSLYLGRGNHYEGVWLSELKLDSALRLQDQFLEYLRKYLVSTSLVTLKVDEKDRIITIEYFKSGKQNRIAFFYKGRELYFYNQYYDPEKDKTYTFLSWSNKKLENSELKNPFEELGISELETDKENEIIPIEKLLEQEKLDTQKITKKDIKRSNRKVKNIEGDLQKIENSQKIYEFLQENRDLSKLDKKTVIHGIRFSFKEQDHFKRQDQIYKKIKRLKEVKGFMQKRFEDEKKKSKAKEKVEIKKNPLNPIKPVIKTVKTKKLESNKLDYKVIQLKDIQIGIGLSSNGNDQLRSQWAKKDDLWFHLDAQTSPHIIAKGTIVSVMDNIEEIAKIMKEEAKIETSEINLMYTQVKNLKGIKSKPGSVIHKKTKYIRVNI